MDPSQRWKHPHLEFATIRPLTGPLRLEIDEDKDYVHVCENLYSPVVRTHNTPATRRGRDRLDSHHEYLYRRPPKGRVWLADHATKESPNF